MRGRSSRHRRRGGLAPITLASTTLGAGGRSAYVRLRHADRQGNDAAEAKSARLKEKIEGLRRQMPSLKEMERQVEPAPDKQVSLSDPDTRSVATSGKGTGIVGYNVQTAVDAEHREQR